MFERISALLTLLLVFGCTPSDDLATDLAHRPAALVEQEGEVCGMMVREQSAPRGQVIHRDGSHFFFCSLGDLLVHLSVPSSHGAVEQVYVELMNVSEDPMQLHMGEHPWVAIDAAVFVVGVARPVFVVGVARSQIMGAPVLTYATSDEADQVMQGHAKARRLDFAELLAWWRSQGAMQ